jgi:hypothetical protein
VQADTNLKSCTIIESKALNNQQIIQLLRKRYRQQLPVTYRVCLIPLMAGHTCTSFRKPELITIMPIKTILIATALSIGLVSCSHNISGVNSSDPYIAQQAQKAQTLKDQVDTQKRLVEAEKQKLKSLQLQLDGAKQNLKGRKMTGS